MKTQTSKIDPAASMESASEAVARAKVLLTTASVEGLTYCEAELAAAIESLENLRLSLEASSGPAASGLQNATQKIRQDVSEFAELLGQAKAFHSGLNALSESANGGYNQEGVPAHVDRDPSRIAVKA